VIHTKLQKVENIRGPFGSVGLPILTSRPPVSACAPCPVTDWRPPVGDGATFSSCAFRTIAWGAGAQNDFRPRRRSHGAPSRPSLRKARCRPLSAFRG
jgi:hypothetical protein